MATSIASTTVIGELGHPEEQDPSAPAEDLREVSEVGVAGTPKARRHPHRAGGGDDREPHEEKEPGADQDRAIEGGEQDDSERDVRPEERPGVVVEVDGSGADGTAEPRQARRPPAQPLTPDAAIPATK